ncbi:MAG: TonB-dependent receptor [Hyphomonadaceae bacterium]|nr:TonB-dependent receptor [Hyphomonadaceae bacterium]
MTEENSIRLATAKDKRTLSFRRLIATGVSMAAFLAAPTALAQTAKEPTEPSMGLDEIIVTAEKRAESANSVPMSITAITGERLADAGITQPRDLTRITPAFIYADSYVGSPIFTLRGVGFSDISLGGRPTVSIYSDEAPIPFAIETRGASLDLERVEILKGPQGTLFGQNATGGAINYVAARPADSFTAGGTIGIGNFASLSAGGFISGPLAETLNARIALEHTRMDGWQRSYTSGDTNGAGDFTNGRLLLDWNPADKLEVQVNLNGWKDRSEVQAGQLIAVTPSIPPLAGFVPGLIGYPLAPKDNRAADFNPADDYGRNNDFRQANVRFDYGISDHLTLTSLTSFSTFSQRQLQDIDGTSLSNLNQLTIGDIESVSEELRLAGDFDRGHFVVGATYAKDVVEEIGFLNETQSTVAIAFTPPLNTFRDESHQDITTWALFASGEISLTDSLSVYGGLRYTEMKNDFNGCTSDTGDGVAAASFGALLGAVIPAGACVTADATFTPGRVFDRLEENNVSWRVGMEWNPAERMMLYANASRGYKAGSFPTLAATVASQLTPATQESVVAYEAGFKTTLFERTLQLNGAVFRYDYSDKQILGKVSDPFLGPLLRLVNVPNSEINGVELQVDWAPIGGLKISAGGSYIDSEILDNFTNFDPNGVLKNFGGESFPNTPEWQFVADGSYTWSASERFDAFVGGNLSYQGETNSQLGELARLEVDAYTLVDLRAGIEAKNGAWKLMAWGRNVGDTYYWTTGNANLDTTVRFAGMPQTYGITLSFRK